MKYKMREINFKIFTYFKLFESFFSVFYSYVFSLALDTYYTAPRTNFVFPLNRFFFVTFWDKLKIHPLFHFTNIFTSLLILSCSKSWRFFLLIHFLSPKAYWIIAKIIQIVLYIILLIIIYDIIDCFCFNTHWIRKKFFFRF